MSNTKHTSGLEFSRGFFEFKQKVTNDVYSAHWTLNTTAPDLKRKYEVSIFFGGGYLKSYYTDFQINKSNSKDFIDLALLAIKKATE